MMNGELLKTPLIEHHNGKPTGRIFRRKGEFQQAVDAAIVHRGIVRFSEQVRTGKVWIRPEPPKNTWSDQDGGGK